jgi:hypothetical protein
VTNTYLLHDHILALPDERVLCSYNCLQEFQILNMLPVTLDAVDKMLDYFLVDFVAQGRVISEDRSNSLSLTDLNSKTYCHQEH